MNQTTTHKIVSNADTLIALKNPCTRFADWGKPAPSSRAEIEEATWGYSTSRSIRRKKKKSKGYKALIGLSSDLDVPTASLIELTQANIAPPENGQSALADVTEEGDRKGSEQSLFGAGSLAVLEAAAPTRSGTGDGPSNASKHVAQDLEPVSTAMIESLEERQIHFHVCAGNLMSASPWFNRLLKKNGWMESNWNPEVRWFHISAEDWDEEAFVVLMNIFHLRNKRVPRAITVDMLAKIAVLADYYECGDSIQLLVDIWVPDLEKKFPIPSVYGRDLILWTWISWALRLPELFKHTTTIVIKQSIEPVRNPGLPIPSWITDELDLRRRQAIGAVVSGLNAQLDIYRSSTYSCPINSRCSFRCGSMLLGALTKQMESTHFLSPDLRVPYFGQSFDAICDAARTIQSEVWLESSYVQHGCSLSTAVVPIVDSVVASVEGLDLRKT